MQCQNLKTLEVRVTVYTYLFVCLSGLIKAIGPQVPSLTSSETSPWEMNQEVLADRNREKGETFRLNSFYIYSLCVLFSILLALYFSSLCLSYSPENELTMRGFRIGGGRQTG